MPRDEVSVEFNAQEVQQLKSTISTINQIITPKIVTLNAEERQKYGSVSEENKLVVNKAKEVIDQQPSFVPNSVDAQEFIRDYKAREIINELINDLDKLVKRLNNTKIMLDYDNYNASLSIYKYIKFLAGENEADAEHWHEQFKQFFTGGRPKQEKNTEEETEE